MNCGQRYKGNGPLSGGKVYLVGAGPSDVELLTVKGRRLLEEADVIVYDRLVGTGFLTLGRRDAIYIDVGKQAGHHPVPQEEINHILVEEAKKGYKVVRLKGGDPFVFGRGAEEAEALSRAGIPFEVVPGITSAVAVPAYLGIPVTHREAASSVHLVTAHKKDGSFPDIHYRALVEGGGTLLFFMGVHTVAEVQEGLLKSGMKADMPAAFLERGTTARQRKICTTVGVMEADARKAKLESPALILVGETAAAEGLDWRGALPLAGKRYIVTRPRKRAAELSGRLRALGGEVLELPMIRLEPVKDDRALRQAAENISEYGWIAFTSPGGVEIFLEKLREWEKDVRCLTGVKIAAIGAGTARRLERAGLYPDLVPDMYDGAHLGQALAAAAKPKEKVLLPRARQGSRELMKILREYSVDAIDLALYDTVEEQHPYIDYKKELPQTDYVLFTSASTVRAFVRQAVGADLTAVKALCIGAQTESEAKGFGMKTRSAKEATPEALVELALEAAEPEG